MTYEEFERVVGELWQRTKNGELRDRQARFAEIERVIDEYITKYGQRPNQRLLDRLATLCLYEEITDPHPDKMSRNEFPIMSDTQREERIDDEVSSAWSRNIGADGRDYQRQTRHYRRKLRNL